MQNRILYTLLALVVLILVVRASAFTVSEGQLAIKSIGGEIVDSNFEPGLHFRIPLVEEVSRFDKRIITQLYRQEMFLTREQEQLKVDFYVKWRINNLRRYYEATGGAEEVANDRLGETVKDSIKTVVTQRTLQQVVTAERAEFTDSMMKNARPSAEQLGVDLVDVRITKIDLPQQVQDSVFDAGSQIARRRRRVVGAHARRCEQAANRNSGRCGAPGRADSRRGRCRRERGVRQVIFQELGVLQLLPQHGVVPGGRGNPGRRAGDRTGQCLLQVFQ
jgi:membrane protease subunit HflC